MITREANILSQVVWQQLDELVVSALVEMRLVCEFGFLVGQAGWSLGVCNGGVVGDSEVEVQS